MLRRCTVGVIGKVMNTLVVPFPETYNLLRRGTPRKDGFTEFYKVHALIRITQEYLQYSCLLLLLLHDHAYMPSHLSSSTSSAASNNIIHHSNTFDPLTVKFHHLCPKKSTLSCVFQHLRKPRCLFLRKPQFYVCVCVQLYVDRSHYKMLLV
ncbi:hypothetical protein GE21DRAFT_1285841, partial [Neurospora crassa]